MALLGALDRLAGGHRTAHAIAGAAHAVETVHLRRQCGIQDQLCSAYGGVNFIEMPEYPRAVVSQLPLPDALRHELQRRLAVIFLGRAHSSSAVHEKVVQNLEQRGPDCPELDALRAAAVRARDAVVAGDIAALGAAMRDNTATQATLHPELVHADAWRVIEIAAAHGAAGWKVNGAGGDGGSITLLGSGDVPRDGRCCARSSKTIPRWCRSRSCSVARGCGFRCFAAGARLRNDPNSQLPRRSSKQRFVGNWKLGVGVDYLSTD